MRALSIIACVLLGAFALAIFGVRSLYGHRHAKAIEFAESREVISEIIVGFGEPLYRSDRVGSVDEWFGKYWGSPLEADQDLCIFHPPGTWPNFQVMVLTGAGGVVEETRIYIP